jgi:hypothetical protein
LQRCIECGDDAFARRAQQAVREVRRVVGVAGQAWRVGERARGELLQRCAGHWQRVGSRQGAGACRDGVGRAIGRGDQCREQQRFAAVETGRRLAEQALARRADAAQLAAKAGLVDVGLEDLALAHARLDALRGADLRPFFGERAPAVAGRAAALQQARELHGERAGAAPRLAR